MKFTVEIDEFWAEEEGSVNLAQELKSQIVNETTHKIKESIKEQVATQIELKVRETINQKVTDIIQNTIDEFVKTGTLSGDYKSSPRMTYPEKIQDTFEKADAHKRIDATLKKVLDVKVTELVNGFKERYDTAFATQIVMKLNEQKFLKEGVVDLLTQKS